MRLWLWLLLAYLAVPIDLVLIVLFCLDWYRRGGREHARSSSAAVVGA